MCLTSGLREEGGAHETGVLRTVLGKGLSTNETIVGSANAGFLGELETLLKEETLVGRGRQCQTELRPLAFSMLAELVHHVRSDLTFAHLSRVIYLFCRSWFCL